MHNSQYYISIFDFLTYVFMPQINISFIIIYYVFNCHLMIRDDVVLRAVCIYYRDYWILCESYKAH